MASEPKVGDVVTPKAGGPKMMIEAIAREANDEAVKSVRCMWFTGCNKETRVFKLEELVHDD